MTGGGLYLPGHDAKHKATLFNAAYAGGDVALATIVEKKWGALYEKFVAVREAREKSAIVKNEAKAERAKAKVEKAKKKSLADQARDAVRAESKTGKTKKSIPTEAPKGVTPVDPETLEPGNKVLFPIGRNMVTGEVITCKTGADGVPVVYIVKNDKKYACEAITVGIAGPEVLAG